MGEELEKTEERGMQGVQGAPGVGGGEMGVSVCKMMMMMTAMTMTMTMAAAKPPVGLGWELARGSSCCYDTDNNDNADMTCGKRESAGWQEGHTDSRRDEQRAGRQTKKIRIKIVRKSGQRERERER